MSWLKTRRGRGPGNGACCTTSWNSVRRSWSRAARLHRYLHTAAARAGPTSREVDDDVEDARGDAVVTVLLFPPLSPLITVRAA